MKSREALDIRCPHEKDGIAESIEVPYYSPISIGELVELMTTATDSSDFRLRNRIQMRLDMAVPGMVCPREIEGPVSMKQALIDELYINEIQKGRTGDFIEKFFHIINADEPELNRLFEINYDES